MQVLSTVPCHVKIDSVYLGDLKSQCFPFGKIHENTPETHHCDDARSALKSRPHVKSVEFVLRSLQDPVIFVLYFCL